MDITKIKEVMESYSNELTSRCIEVSNSFYEEARKNDVRSEISMIGLYTVYSSDGVGVVDGEFGFVEVGYECSFSEGICEQAEWIIQNNWREVAKEKINSSINELIREKKEKEQSEIEKALKVLKKYGVHNIEIGCENSN